MKTTLISIGNSRGIRIPKPIIVAPMTTSGSRYPTRIDYVFQEVEGQVALDQIRTVDKIRLAQIKFDISWANSWRYTNINHDAAWLFFKVQQKGTSTWQHAILEGAGTNPPGYVPGTAGTPIELIVPPDCVGLFVRRSGDGIGATSAQNVSAIWNFTSNSLVKTDKARILAMAIEMVYVAEGSFKVGDGATTTIQGPVRGGHGRNALHDHQ